MATKYPFKIYLNHAMIDVETFGTGERAVVASIGAVRFTAHNIDENGGFYETLKWQEQLDNGGTVTEGTIKFWLRQLDKVREPLLRGGGKPVADVLAQLGVWFGKNFNEDDFCVWAKGPQFDLSLIRSLYDRWKMNCPWIYWQERDVRTALMLDAAYQIGRPQGSDEHHAFDDAMFQAKQVQRFLVGTGMEGLAKRKPEALAGKGEQNANAEDGDLLS